MNYEPLVPNNGIIHYVLLSLAIAHSPLGFSFCFLLYSGHLISSDMLLDNPPL